MKLNSSVYTFQPIPSMFLALIIILYQSHLNPMISVEYVLVFLYYAKKEYLKYLLIHQNNLKMLSLP